MDKEKADVLFKYYLSISGTKHLHYGYWEEGEELTMKNLRLAQERYSDRLISFIPPGATKIPFFLTTFEEFKSQEKFDLVLISESCQYIDIEKGLRKCTEII